MTCQSDHVFLKSNSILTNSSPSRLHAGVDRTTLMRSEATRLSSKSLPSHCIGKKDQEISRFGHRRTMPAKGKILMGLIISPYPFSFVWMCMSDPS